MICYINALLNLAIYKFMRLLCVSHWFFTGVSYVTLLHQKAVHLKGIGWCHLIKIYCYYLNSIWTKSFFHQAFFNNCHEDQIGRKLVLMKSLYFWSPNWTIIWSFSVFTALELTLKACSESLYEKKFTKLVSIKGL